MLVCCVLPSLLNAQDLGEIKQRMKSRVVKIDSLKKAGTVGVDNRGYLVIRASGVSEADAKLVAAENADRQTVYTYLAKRVGAPVEKVEKQRAAEITKQSAKGVWLQDAEGNWYQK